MSARFFEWIDGLFRLRRQPIPTGWERIPAVQNTDSSIRLVNVIQGIAGAPRWTGPTGSRLAAYREHRGDTPIPTGQPHTGGIPKPPVLSIREVHRRSGWSDMATAKNPPESAWLTPPAQHKPDANVVPEFDPVDTLLPDWARQQTEEWQPSGPIRPLPPGFSDENLVPDLPTEIQKHDPGDAWLNSPAPVLNPLPTGQLAVADRTASLESVPTTWEYVQVSGEEEPSALERLTVLASQTPDEDTMHGMPAVVRQRYEKKERE